MASSGNLNPDVIVRRSQSVPITGSMEENLKLKLGMDMHSRSAQQRKKLVDDVIGGAELILSAKLLVNIGPRSHEGLYAVHLTLNTIYCLW